MIDYTPREIASRLYRRAAEMHQRRADERAWYEQSQLQRLRASEPMLGEQFRRQRVRENLDEWYANTPWDNEERQAYIVAHGLPARVYWKESAHDPNNPLYTIRVDPRAGWTDLMSQARATERYAVGSDVEPYHVSIGFKRDYEGDVEAQQEIKRLRDKYTQPRDHVFQITHFGSGNTANLDWGDEIAQDVWALHQKGRYRAADLHISMV